MYFSIDYWMYMIPAILLMMIAQWWVNATYRKWSRVGNSQGLSGAEVAQRLLRYENLRQVSLQGASGRLSDHYDPRSQTLHLSPEVAGQASVASLAIAAHEIGHADQHAERYFPLSVRSALVPAVNIGSTLGWIMILIGLFLGFTGLAWLGVIAFSMGALFALATLPVELNASARARRMLESNGLIRSEQERRGVSAVLNAAAMTYVAGLATSLLQLLYYVSLVSGLGRRRS